MKEFLDDFIFIFKHTARLYLSPFVGAARGIKEEYKRFDAANAARFGTPPSRGGAAQ